jgi:hypothetical protein
MVQDPTKLAAFKKIFAGIDIALYQWALKFFSAAPEISSNNIITGKS